MSFWSDVGRFVDPGGVVSGFLGGKGALGGVGGTLFGTAGDVGFEASPPPQLIDRPIEREDFTYRDTGRATALGELERSRQGAAPQVGTTRPGVRVSGFTPERYGGATIDRGGYGQQMGAFAEQSRRATGSRTQQIQDLGLTREAALGRAPSVAEQQLREGMERSIAAQSAAAASARGGPGAREAARRQAAFGASDVRAETNRAAAALRADEMAQARSQLLAGGEAVRAGDLSAQDIQLNAAQLALQPDLQQAVLAQQAGLQTQALGAQAGMQETGLQTQADLQTQQLGTQVDLANLQAALQNRGLGNQYNLGLLGILSDQDKARMAGTMGYSGMMQEEASVQNQLYANYWKALQDYRAGVAGQNAQANLMRSSGGLGFLGGMTSMLAVA